MKRLLIPLAILLLAGGCDEDPRIQELKNINAEQRQQIARLLESQKAAVDQLSVQLSREAQSDAEQKVVRTKYCCLSWTSRAASDSEKAPSLCSSMAFKNCASRSFSSLQFSSVRLRSWSANSLSKVDSRP